MVAKTFEPIAPRPAPVQNRGLAGWLRSNLFADWKTSLSTVILGGLMLWYLPQVLNYFIHRVTNAFSEGMNSRIQGLIKQANGYRNRERLKRDLYFHLGNLDMLPIMQ